MSECTRPRCGKHTWWRGLCRAHYEKYRSLGYLTKVDSETVAKHLQILMEVHDWRVHELVRQTGINKTGLLRIRRQEFDYCRRATANIILSIPLAPPPWSLRGKMPVLGLRRRSRALACLGYTFKRQDQLLGWPEGRLVNLNRERVKFVEIAWHDQFCELYERISMTPAKPPRDGDERTIARWTSQARKRWTPPLGWDDEPDGGHHIDDPRARPRYRRAAPDRGYQLQRELLADGWRVVR